MFCKLLQKSSLEAFLKKYGDKFEFYSAGLSPLDKPNMDPRSIKYLEEQGIKNIIHNPKRISKMLDYFDFFIAIDLIILNELNLKFPKYKQKFFLASSHLNSINYLILLK